MKHSEGARRVHRLCRAVFTVEASVIVPIAVFITALLIIMTFYVHNRCWYNCAAYECANKGNAGLAFSIADSRNMAENQAQGRIDDQVMPGSEPSKKILVTEAGTYVSFSGQTYAMFNRELTPFLAEASVARVNPESYLRKLWAAAEVGDALKE